MLCIGILLSWHAYDVMFWVAKSILGEKRIMLPEHEHSFNHFSGVTGVNPTECPKSVRNRCVIEVFGSVFVLSRCFFYFSVSVGTFVIGLSQISSLFS